MTTPPAWQIPSPDEAAEIDESAHTPDPRLCDACKNPDKHPGHVYLMTVEEGVPSFACSTPGCEGHGPNDWIDDDVPYSQLMWAEKAPPVPVTVAVDSDCGDLGGYHFNGRCDHDWWYAITPAVDNAQLKAEAEAERLRGLIAELLPYAWAGADALDVHEPYGPQGESHTLLCERADVMLARIKSGEFGEVPRG